MQPIYLRDTVIEKIGSTNMYFLPCDKVKEELDGNEGDQLRCYSDPDIGTFNNNYSEPCDFLTSIIGIEQPLNFRISPSPFSQKLVISLINQKSDAVDIMITDVSGSVLYNCNTCITLTR